MSTRHRPAPLTRVFHGLLLAGVLMPLAGLTGCGRSDAASGGGVGVIDLGVIISSLGRDQAMDQRLQEIMQALDQQLEQTKQKFQAELQAQEQQLGPDASAEQRQAFQRLVQQTSSRFQMQMQRAQEISQSAQSMMMEQVRHEVQPIAQRIARAKGLRVVLLQTPMVLLAEPEADLTQDVIAAMQASGIGASQPPLPPLPPLEGSVDQPGQAGQPTPMAPTPMPRPMAPAPPAPQSVQPQQESAEPAPTPNPGSGVSLPAQPPAGLQ